MEILHDLQFKASSSSVAISEDQNYMIATGGYPPEVRIFDLSDLGMKVARRLDNEVLQGEFLSEDYRKLVMLCTNRYVEFHAQYGKHHVMRLPKFGRAMRYDRASCELFIASSSDSIFRMDLEQGAYLAPFVSSCGDEHTSLALAPLGLPLLMGGLSNGCVECWDTRSDSKSASSMVVSGDSREVRQIAWSPDAMQIACGLDSGVVKVYDIRSSKSALFERDHRNDFPIVGLQFVSRSVLGSADYRSVKIWQLEDSVHGAPLAFIESKDKLNGLKFWPNGSGLFFTPCESAKVGTYFLPTVGPAPKWCAYLDTIVGESEAGVAANGVIPAGPAASSSAPLEDYVFVTKEQLQALGAENLIGTSVVKAYMHGFWIDKRVHAKLRDVAEPFLYEKYQQEKIQQQLEANRPMRMPIRNTADSKKSINAQLQRDLSDRLTSLENKKSNVIASNLLEDARFGKLWSNADFEIEEVRKTQEDDAFAQIGKTEVERIDVKVVNRVGKKMKKK